MNSSHHREHVASRAQFTGPGPGDPGGKLADCESTLQNRGARNVGSPDIRRGMARAGLAEGEGAEPDGSSTGGAARLQASPSQIDQFHALYREQFDFVFRNLRRLGVPAEQVDDAVQDVFMVVLRRLDQYQAGSHPKAWLFAIALRVARNYRRSMRRKDSRLSAIDGDVFSASSEHDPFERAARTEAVRLLHAFLERIHEDKRSVFIMTELEQMSAPEIADALHVNLNTIYARIRAARREFEQAVATAEQGER